MSECVCEEALRNAIEQFRNAAKKMSQVNFDDTKVQAAREVRAAFSEIVQELDRDGAFSDALILCTQPKGRDEKEVTQELAAHVCLDMQQGLVRANELLGGRPAGVALGRVALGLIDLLEGRSRGTDVFAPNKRGVKGHRERSIVYLKHWDNYLSLMHYVKGRDGHKNLRGAYESLSPKKTPPIYTTAQRNKTKVNKAFERGKKHWLGYEKVGKAVAIEAQLSQRQSEMRDFCEDLLSSDEKLSETINAMVLGLDFEGDVAP